MTSLHEQTVISKKMCRTNLAIYSNDKQKTIAVNADNINEFLLAEKGMAVEAREDGYGVVVVFSDSRRIRDLKIMFSDFYLLFGVDPKDPSKTTLYIRP